MSVDERVEELEKETTELRSRLSELEKVLAQDHEVIHELEQKSEDQPKYVPPKPSLSPVGL